MGGPLLHSQTMKACATRPAEGLENKTEVDTPNIGYRNF